MLAKIPPRHCDAVTARVVLSKLNRRACPANRPGMIVTPDGEPS
jgi:hypothetical protein